MSKRKSSSRSSKTQPKKKTKPVEVIDDEPEKLETPEEEKKRFQQLEHELDRRRTDVRFLLGQLSTCTESREGEQFASMLATHYARITELQPQLTLYKAKHPEPFTRLLNCKELVVEAATGLIYHVFGDIVTMRRIPCDLKGDQILHVVENDFFALVTRSEVAFFTYDDIVNHDNYPNDGLSFAKVFTHNLFAAVDVSEYDEVFMDYALNVDMYGLALYSYKRSPNRALLWTGVHDEEGKKEDIVQQHEVTWEAEQESSSKRLWNIDVTDGAFTLILEQEDTHSREYIFLNGEKLANGILDRKGEAWCIEVHFDDKDELTGASVVSEVELKVPKLE